MEHTVWKISALELPRVVRRCPRCDGARSFVSSGKFRVNAQKRRLDVWLVHKCAACDETWNAPVHERVRPEDIPLAPYHDNDQAAARRLAFAVAGADRAVAVAVSRPALTVGPLAITFRLVDPVVVRLDRLLASELGLPRAQVPHLRGRVSDGQTVVVSSRRREDRSDPCT